MSVQLLYAIIIQEFLISAVLVFLDNYQTLQLSILPLVELL